MKNSSKKIILILISWALLSSLPLHGNENTELAARYLKLATTYLMSGNIEKAGENIKSAEKLLSTSKSNDWDTKYWRAVSQEYRGYMNFYLGMKDEAKSNLLNARKQFSDLIKMKGGSQEAVNSINSSLEIIEINLQGASVLKGFSDSKILNFDNQKIKDDFSQISSKVENLSLSNNRIKNIYGLMDKTNLKYLNLSDNRLKELPLNIDKLAKLEWLDLSNNRLKELPPSVCNLKNLKVLNLKNNRLPIEDITNLIKCLPNTNILYDEYIKKNEQQQDENENEFDF